MAPMLSFENRSQQLYSSIPDKSFAIKHIDDLDDYAIIAKGNIIEGIEEKW